VVPDLEYVLSPTYERDQKEKRREDELTGDSTCRLRDGLSLLLYVRVHRVSHRNLPGYGLQVSKITKLLSISQRQDNGSVSEP